MLQRTQSNISDEHTYSLR